MKQTQVMTGDREFEIEVRPGMTKNEVLRQLDLPASYWVSLEDALPFRDEDDLYREVQSGQRLYATPPAVVGA